MPKGRLEAFTDAIIAIIMTVLVLELHEPTGGDFAALFAERHPAAHLPGRFHVGYLLNNHPSPALPRAA